MLGKTKVYDAMNVTVTENRAVESLAVVPSGGRKIKVITQRISIPDGAIDRVRNYKLRNTAAMGTLRSRMKKQDWDTNQHLLTQIVGKLKYICICKTNRNETKRGAV